MKFKKGDRVECIKEYPYQFTKGKIYIVREDGLSERGYLLVEEDDRGKTNGHYPKYFKLIEENKMKTDKKTMALVLRRAARNIDRGLKPFKDIQYLGHYGAWIDMVGLDIDESVEYRIKPETITLKNGVTIPKPLDVDSIDNDKFYYYPCVDRDYFDRADGRRIKDSGTILFYASMNEAREAGKALFGIE